MNKYIAHSVALLIVATVLAIASTGCSTVPVPTATLPATPTPAVTATTVVLPTQQALVAPTQTTAPTPVATSTPTLGATPTTTTQVPTVAQVVTTTSTLQATASVTRAATIAASITVTATRVAGTATSPTRAATTVPTARPTTARAPVPSPGMMTVKLFLVALNDNGKSGKMIGCQDSVVAVDRAIPETSAPLTAALNQLLSIHTQYYGQSGLYNALYQSNLKLSGVSITSGKAIINLTGTYSLGGVCDGPRFIAQIQETALQFSTVQEVAVFLNGKPIDVILSGKG